LNRAGAASPAARVSVSEAGLSTIRFGAVMVVTVGFEAVALAAVAFETVAVACESVVTIGIAEVAYPPRLSSRTISPADNSITRRCIWSTMPASCVAIMTVVPPALIRSRRAMMPALVVGSRFPVGSSARRIWGLLTMRGR
jgi:hypothetical protein